MIKKIKGFLFNNQDVRQTVAKNTFWLTVSNIGGRLIRAVIIVYAARVLGAEGWGVFSYAISLIGLITIFADLGIGAVLTREMAKSSDEKYQAKIVATSFVLKLILAVTGVVIIITAASSLSAIEEAKPLLPIVAFVLLFDAIREFTSAIARAKERMEIEAGIFILTNLAIVVFGFVFLWLSPTAKSFSYAYAAGTGLGMIAALYALQLNIWRMLKDFSLKLLRPIFAAAWPVAISGLLAGLMINTDMVIIGIYQSAEEVGFYSAAERLSQFIQIIPSIIAISVFPIFSRLASTDKQKMRGALEKVISLCFFIALPIALGGVVLSSQIVGFVFGNSYLPASAPFQILLLVLAINFSGSIFTNAIFAYNRLRVLLISAVIAGGLNVILDLILIPKFGILGSAWATFVALLANNIFLWYKMAKINYFNVLPYIKKMVLVSVIMALGSFSMARLGVGLISNLVISIAAYFGILYLLKEPMLKEFKLVLGLK